jgi:hypothetical protein
VRFGGPVRDPSLAAFVYGLIAQERGRLRFWAFVGIPVWSVFTGIFAFGAHGLWDVLWVTAFLGCIAVGPVLVARAWRRLDRLESEQGVPRVERDG